MGFFDWFKSAYSTSVNAVQSGVNTGFHVVKETATSGVNAATTAVQSTYSNGVNFVADKFITARNTTVKNTTKVVNKAVDKGKTALENAGISNATVKTAVDNPELVYAAWQATMNMIRSGEETPTASSQGIYGCELKANPLIQEYMGSRKKVREKVQTEFKNTVCPKMQTLNAYYNDAEERYPHLGLKNTIENLVFDKAGNTDPNLKEIQTQLGNGLHQANAGLGINCCGNQFQKNFMTFKRGSKCKTHKHDSLNTLCFLLQKGFPDPPVCTSEAKCCVKLIKNVCPVPKKATPTPGHDIMVGFVDNLAANKDMIKVDNLAANKDMIKIAVNNPELVYSALQ